ncbi:unnamed protein product [Triticum turgidum subsp. durum]|uniref:Uncharacterized protein n=1 Tax=Triticum turgidum subsp. durum TaxID=4567 RepID=A0A9R1AR53_TRITD|nr:unnamed protein product [Triticum turgidum subsp. durum]
MAKSFLAMKTGPAAGASEASQALLESDLRELTMAARKLANHAIVLGGGIGFIGTFLQWLAFAASVGAGQDELEDQHADGPLGPLHFLHHARSALRLHKVKIGAWIAFVVVVLRLFFPRHFPDWLELPGSLILLTVVAPAIFADTFRGSWLIIGVGVCLVIGCYLLHEHIKASGGLKEAFQKTNGWSNTIGILLLFIYPVWAVVMWFL